MAGEAGERTADKLRGRLTSRHVLALAVPVMVSNATTPLVGLVDTAVIGQLGRPELMGGVAVAATIFNMLYGACYFLQLGTTGFTAQSVGAGETGAIAANLLRPLVAALAIGLVIAVFRTPIAALGAALVGGSPAVAATAVAYFEITALAAPAVLGQMAVMGWLIGLGRTSIVFALQLVLNLVNIALLWLFVMRLGWGVPGAATATALAQATAFAAGVGYCLALVARERWRLSRADVFSSAEIARALATNRDITIRTLCITGVFAFFVSEGARGGDVLLAANAALFQLTMVAVYLIDGFETAAQTLVGQAVGARDKTRYDDAVRLCFGWAGVAGLVLAIGLLSAGPALIALLAANEEVRASAGRYLVWAALVPIVSLWAFILDGIFIGATRAVDLRNMLLISTAVYGAAWLVLSRLYGNHGLWVALIVFFAVRGVTLGLRMPALARDAFGSLTPPSDAASSSSRFSG